MKKILILMFSIFTTNNIYSQSSIFDIKINDINGKAINLSDYKDKYILFVNVASQCGFTSQYKGLEELYNNYSDKLIIIGVPCNQFGRQEPGSEEEIKNFCEINYGVSFLLTEKLAVKGEKQHPLYSWLTNKTLNGKMNSSVKWNFQKYIVGPGGELVDYFYSSTKPLSNKITLVIEK